MATSPILLLSSWNLSCNCVTSLELTEEFTVFCKSSPCPQGLHFVPTWAPSWSLSCIMVNAIAVVAWDRMTPRMDWPSEESLFLSWFRG